MPDFKKQVAIITGSSEGIGLSVSIMLAEKGSAVIINGRDKDRLLLAEKKLQAIPGARFSLIQGDIMEEDVRNEIVQTTVRHYDKIDILINNAGGGTNIHRIEEITDEDWYHSMEFNLNSSFFMCRAAVPVMRKNKYGRIVNVSSVAGRFRGRLSGPHYSAAKAGLLGMTRHLARDLAPDGITVNAVAPGFVNTRRALNKWNDYSGEEKNYYLRQIPLNRFAEPEEIASAILFLASPDASYITGATLDVNGGFFMS